MSVRRMCSEHVHCNPHVYARCDQPSARLSLCTCVRFMHVSCIGVYRLLTCYASSDGVCYCMAVCGLNGCSVRTSIFFFTKFEIHVITSWSCVAWYIRGTHFEMWVNMSWSCGARYIRGAPCLAYKRPMVIRVSSVLTQFKKWVNMSWSRAAWYITALCSPSIIYSFCITSRFVL